MFGAIYIGLSGLNAYSRGLEQVSGNVSNLNSSGFKSTTVGFADLMGSGGEAGISRANSGGSTGTGVELASLRRDFAQGELRQTQRDLDLAVDGNGFLVLMKGDQTFYTRTGSFEVNKDGFIVLAGTDYRLATLDASGQPVNLSVDTNSTHIPEETKLVKFADNLSSTATTHSVSGLKVYDKLGTQHLWKAQFTKPTGGAPGEWTVTVTDGKAATIGTQTLKFNLGTVDPTTSKLVFAEAASGLSVTLDFSENVTSFSSGEISTLRSASVDGHGIGTVTNVTVDADGLLQINYSNEKKKSLGAVAIADFRDPQSLKQKSGGLYADEGGTAGRDLASSASEKVGKVLSRRLEASNVDLAKQFGDLITIQRGYQASSQIISVANDMIQQLFGIRGQG